MNISEVTEFLTANDIEFEVPANNFILTSFAGTNRKTITIAINVGAKYLNFECFIARNPDENHEIVYRWLLEQNLKLLSASYAVDQFGDIYLRSSLISETATSEVLDQMFGIFALHADSSFNVLLELGFRSAIEREWTWRTSRGMNIDNLTAFSHLFDQ